jgi:hypothetical protein
MVWLMGPARQSYSELTLPWWRRLLCCWGHCPCRLYKDAGGIGGQCIRCGKIVGYVTRAELRAAADRAYAGRKH